MLLVVAAAGAQREKKECSLQRIGEWLALEREPHLSRMLLNGI
jgi:hypothetical protein